MLAVCLGRGVVDTLVVCTLRTAKLLRVLVREHCGPASLGSGALKDAHLRARHHSSHHSSWKWQRRLVGM